MLQKKEERRANKVKIYKCILKFKMYEINAKKNEIFKYLIEHRKKGEFFNRKEGTLKKIEERRVF